jgi:S-DNA-T family DNA segregation ATPase FtsK/SpoIIIE
VPRAKKIKVDKRPQKRLSPEKTGEILGLALLIVGALLAVSLASYHPDDPSLFTERDLRAQNWAGRVGAQVADFLFQFIGVSALLLPVFVLVTGWRRLRHQSSSRVTGRGIGALIMVICLPALLHLLLGDIPWRGSEIRSGGAFGAVLSDAALQPIGRPGSLLLFAGGVVIAAALLIQSTLGEVLAVWKERIAGLWQRFVLVWSRNRERKGRDRQRRKVVEKQMKKAARVKKARVKPQSKIDLPLRVTEKEGEGKFSVRKVSAPGVDTPAEVEEPAKPQKTIPFPKPKAGKIPLPPLDLFDSSAPKISFEENELVRLGDVIRGRCAEFGVQGTVEGISPGPVITVFEFQPAPGVKVSKIVNLQDDLALALKAESVRIERLPGRSTLGIEVPNDERAIIRLGHMLARKSFQKTSGKLTVAIGMTIHGEPHYANLATMPHLLVAGATGSGKSVALQSMITSILMKANREEVQFIFIDPKRIELGVYKDIPHLKTEVVVEPKKASNALRWAVSEMERRYRLLAEVHVRSIDHYNKAIQDPELKKRLALNDDDEEDMEAFADLSPLPYYVIVIDELADLMMVASNEVEMAIARLAQMARAVGLHLIVATQRPSVDVLTGTIKANFPCRMAFATASRHDSRTILDAIGAEKLLGKGDMLFMPPGTSRLMRLHGPYISEQETAGLIRWLKQLGKPELDLEILKAPPEDRASAGGGGSDGEDEMFDEAARLVVSEGMASASFLQRRLRVGFSRAARLIDMMEQDGLLGPPQGSKPREVLVKPDFFEEWDEARRDVEG